MKTWIFEIIYNSVGGNITLLSFTEDEKSLNEIDYIYIYIISEKQIW